jgi:hypothetical protein
MNMQSDHLIYITAYTGTEGHVCTCWKICIELMNVHKQYKELAFHRRFHDELELDMHLINTHL